MKCRLDERTTLCPLRSHVRENARVHAPCCLHRRQESKPPLCITQSDAEPQNGERSSIQQRKITQHEQRTV
jgi:hypothetical protein